MATFTKLVESAVQAAAKELELKGGESYTLAEMTKNQEILGKLMSPRKLGERAMPRISVSEALHGADASILFPRVISDVLIRPVEPHMIGQTVLSRVVEIDNTRQVEFPSLGAIQAYDMGDTQEYREQLPAFAEHATEIKVNKVGLMLGIAEDIIVDSMWDVLALYIEQAGYAMVRAKEKKIFDEYAAKAQVVFDNALNLADAQTRGKAANQSLNGSLSMVDLLDAMGAMIANEYNPTDLVIHPLGWTVFAKDPILRFQMLWKGGLGQNFGAIGPDPMAIAANAPFGVATQVTPFAPFTSQTTIGSSNAGDTYSHAMYTLGASNVCDINLIDRKNPLIVLQRDAPSTDESQEWKRDIRLVKFRERYGVGVLNGGRSVVAIKNIRLVDNMESMFTTNTVTPA